MRGLRICLTLAVAAMLCGVIGMVGGCEIPHNDTGPTGPQLSRDRAVIDGVRTNGTEMNANGEEVQTYEAWAFGQKLPGPSPEGNFWTEADADMAYIMAKYGVK